MIPLFIPFVIFVAIYALSGYIILDEKTIRELEKEYREAKKPISIHTRIYLRRWVIRAVLAISGLIVVLIELFKLTQ